jgi:hypothetical protein
MSIALLSLIPATALGANSVGINTHIPSPEVLDEVAAMGMTWIRVDNDWHSFEPRQGEYHFGALDRSVRAAHERGQKVFMTIGYTPEWASSGRRTDTIPSSHNQVPRAGLYEAYVRETVRHYRDMGVTHFGLWNEANLDQFFEGSAREYADIIVTPGEQAVRQVCADCVVLGPELAPVGDVDDFLEDVMDACGDRFDIITHHLYGDWEETGWQIWDGDSFLNALEDQRFPWTRRSMRQVLESTGYGDVEVWITETGWRENPIGDPDERRLQAIYARRVLEEQWQRDWWTNTFFYEITDAIGFDIDGFGFVRPREGGGFDRKPVFEEVRNFLAGHPQSDPADEPAPAPEPDPDPDPVDDPPVDPPNDELEAVAREASDRPSIDAQLGDWAGVQWIELDRASWQSPDGFVLDGPADLSAEFAAQWDESTLFFAVRVRDDIHQVADDPALAWTADSVQIAFDPRNDGGEGYGEDDHELGLFDSGAHRWHGGGGPIAAAVAVRRDGGTTLYEAAIPLALISPVHTMGSIGFDILINDADGAGREGWLEWAGGMGWAKRPEIFGHLRFVGAGVAPPEDNGDPEGEDDPAGEDPAGDPDPGAGDPPADDPRNPPQDQPEEQRDRDEPSVEIGDRDDPGATPLPSGDLGEGEPVGPPEEGLVAEDAGGDGESGCAVSHPKGSLRRLLGGLVVGGLVRRR